MKQQIPVTLIITTYNWPEALRLCLDSLKRQSELPDEVIIADDGSTDDTKAVIDAFRPQLPCPLKHVWQEDRGYRRSAILNKALRATSPSHYVIFIDGDVILHKHFIADHCRLAEPGYYVFGRRALPTKETSNRILCEPKFTIHFFTPGIDHRLNLLYLPWLTPLTVSYKRHKVYGFGCNLAAWLDDIITINGYNEEMEGWGCEDTDFILRLRNNGLVSKAAKFQAIVVHIWHPQQPVSEENKRIYARLVEKKELRCEYGISYPQNIDNDKAHQDD